MLQKLPSFRKKKQKNKDKNMGKVKKGKLFGFLKSKKSLGL